MADATELEAELLAALGSLPLPNEPAANGTEAPQPQPAGPPTQDENAVSASLTIPDRPTPTTAPAPAPDPFTVSTSVTIAASAPGPTTPSTVSTLSAHDTLPAPESTTKIPSPPPLQPAQSFMQTSEPSHANATSQQPQQPLQGVPNPAPQETGGARSPKRPRTPDDIDGSNVKRQKTDHSGQVQENGVEAPNFDLAAELSDALAELDQQARPEGDDIIMPDAETTVVRVGTPEPEKAENKIMKASSNPFYVMRSMSLPVLGNIAVQILLRLSQQSLAETQSLLADTESEFRKAYDILLDIFRSTRKAFSDSPLVSPDELEITDVEDRETVRMSNLAATAASVFGAHDVPLKEVHDALFSVFIPEDGEYSSPLTEFVVCLKTRLLLDALDKPDQSQVVSQLLNELFPANFDNTLKERSGDSHLSPDEEVLVGQIRERRELLVRSAADEPIKKTLEAQSSSAKLAEGLSAFLQSHLGVIVDYAEKYGVNIPPNEDEMVTSNGPQEEHDGLAALLHSHLAKYEGVTEQGQGVLSDGSIPGQVGVLENGNDDLTKLIEEGISKHVPELKEPSASQHASTGLLDFDSKNLATLISEKLKNELEIPTHGLPNLSTPDGSSLAGSATMHPQFMAQLTQNNQSAYQPYPQNSASTTSAAADGEALPPNQSMPTAALYERARQAAVAKSSNTTRREGLHSTRRPWTPEEEKALMAGLDMVKGPHWSQILQLFGKQGTISTILKDRTQVQLKDKARNLKLFFLKTNSEMPYYLQSVTGELKTRAPSQAARKEAEEKARMQVEEEQARIQGIMTLAGGLQNHRPVSSAPLAASPPKQSSSVTAGMGGTSAGATAAAHMSMSAMTVPSAVPISPRVKTEPSDHQSFPKTTAFPPIQPAPAPAPATQQAARHPLPPLQPFPGLPQQRPPQPPQPQASTQMQPLPQQQQQQQQNHQVPAQLPQQHHEVQPQQQQQPPPQQQQQHPQPLAQSQIQPPPITQPVPQSSLALQSALPQPATSQPASQPSPQPQPSQGQGQAGPAVAADHQPLPTPPIPPNHHSTPDHAQDTEIMEKLQAAIADENQNHVRQAGQANQGTTMSGGSVQ